VDVSEIAVSFGGGGHIRASGCSIKDATLEETMNMVLTRTKESLKKYEVLNLK
jgi:phosphoesterase RecJ-like protein